MLPPGGTQEAPVLHGSQEGTTALARLFAPHAPQLHIFLSQGSILRSAWGLILIPSSLDSTSGHFTFWEPPDHPGPDKAGLGSVTPQIREGREAWPLPSVSQPIRAARPQSLASHLRKACPHDPKGKE